MRGREGGKGGRGAGELLGAASLYFLTWVVGTWVLIYTMLLYCPQGTWAMSGDICGGQVLGVLLTSSGWGQGILLNPPTVSRTPPQSMAQPLVSSAKVGDRDLSTPIYNC